VGADPQFASEHNEATHQRLMAPLSPAPCGDSARLGADSVERVRVLLADDHSVFAESLRLLISRDDRIEVVGWARDGEEAVALAESLQPDVVLMDIGMPVMDGVEATREIRRASPRIHVLILTSSDMPGDIDRAREAGASGFLTKKQSVAELMDAVLEISSLTLALGAGPEGAGRTSHR
jgi:CheY-like chemotaxis protein